MYTHFFSRLSSLSQKNLLDSFTSFCSFSLFNFQGPACHLLGDSFLIISHTFLFVNNFFLLSTSFFQTSLCISLSLSEQLIYYTTLLQFVNYFFILFSFSSCYLRHALLSVPVLYTYLPPLSTVFFQIRHSIQKGDFSTLFICAL